MAAVRNAMSFFPGKRGQDYMSQIISLHPALMQSQAETTGMMRAEERKEMMRAAKRKAVPDHQFDVQPMLAGVMDSLQAHAATAESSLFNLGRQKVADNLKSTGELRRQSEGLFGSDPEGNVAQKLIDKFLEGDGERAKLTEAGDKLAVKLANYAKKNREAVTKMADVIHDSTWRRSIRARQTTTAICRRRACATRGRVLSWRGCALSTTPCRPRRRSYSTRSPSCTAT